AATSAAAARGREASLGSSGIVWGAGTHSSGSDSRSGIFEDPFGMAGRSAGSWVGARVGVSCFGARCEAVWDSAGGDVTAAGRDGFWLFDAVFAS
ncbi:MAG: hypothetical protein ACE5MG_07480, partial [Candidatus Methylomirabilales bacterium]